MCVYVCIYMFVCIWICIYRSKALDDKMERIYKQKTPELLKTQK